MIPKIIHYVWVGNAPKSELVKKCIRSWREHLPDYEIIEWNNDRFAEITNSYAKEAFQCGKWAFVSDYIRLHALYEHGGFYFDSDLEITKNIDEFRGHEFVTGFELYEEKTSPVTAFLGATQGNEIIRHLLSEYEELKFIKENGDLDLTTNTKRISDYFSRNFSLSLPYNPHNKIALTNGSYIYPYFYFCTPAPEKENYSIHHFNGSWVEGFARRTMLRVKNIKVCAIKRITSKPRNLPIYSSEKLLTHIPLPLGFGFMILCTK